MSAEEFYERMKELTKCNYEEQFHIEADDLMCLLLRQLGYEKGVEVFENTPKWYS